MIVNNYLILTLRFLSNSSRRQPTIRGSKRCHPYSPGSTPPPTQRPMRRKLNAPERAGRRAGGIRQDRTRYSQGVCNHLSNWDRDCGATDCIGSATGGRILKLWFENISQNNDKMRDTYFLIDFPK